VGRLIARVRFLPGLRFQPTLRSVSGLSVGVRLAQAAKRLDPDKTDAGNGQGPSSIILLPGSLCMNESVLY
jgi:hypothetical protein